jgi:hypothetical protein
MPSTEQDIGIAKHVDELIPTLILYFTEDILRQRRILDLFVLQRNPDVAPLVTPPLHGESRTVHLHPVEAGAVVNHGARLSIALRRSCPGKLDLLVLKRAFAGESHYFREL